MAAMAHGKPRRRARAARRARAYSARRVLRTLELAAVLSRRSERAVQQRQARRRASATVGPSPAQLSVRAGGSGAAREDSLLGPAWSESSGALSGVRTFGYWPERPCRTFAAALLLTARPNSRQLPR